MGARPLTGIVARTSRALAAKAGCWFGVLSALGSGEATAGLPAVLTTAVGAAAGAVPVPAQAVAEISSSPASPAAIQSTAPDLAVPRVLTLCNLSLLHAVAPGLPAGRLKTGPSLPAHTATRGHIAPMPDPRMGAM
ncbi:hypothetical protein BJQ90_01705 [Arthrobacter sp. SO3]|nr:hypothetical protein [Arthrobacter sp. SO3]